MRTVTNTFRILGVAMMLATLAGCGRSQVHGQCPAGTTLCDCELDGTCHWCGDDSCNSLEDCNSCPQDCTCEKCGDGQCGSGESCSSCPDDCGTCPVQCGDGQCEAPSETCSNCPSDCGKCPATCGDG